MLVIAVCVRYVCPRRRKLVLQMLACVRSWRAHTHAHARVHTHTQAHAHTHTFTHKHSLALTRSMRQGLRAKALRTRGASARTRKNFSIQDLVHSLSGRLISHRLVITAWLATILVEASQGTASPRAGT